MSRKGNKTLRDLSDLGKELDIKGLEKEIVSNKPEVKEVTLGSIESKVKFENKTGTILNEDEIKEIDKIVKDMSSSITLDQLKAELIYTKDSLFKGIQMYFDKRLDYTQRQIKNVEEKIDSLDKKIEVLIDREEGLKRVSELDDKLNKLQEILKM